MMIIEKVMQVSPKLNLEQGKERNQKIIISAYVTGRMIFVLGYVE